MRQKSENQSLKSRHSTPDALVIGAGLAGCEAAWQLAERGINVTLCDMKPKRRSAAHHSNGFAELVCSNSLKSNDVNSAAGLLKEELRIMGSLLISCADEVRVPAGGALAVDREAFSSLVTQKIVSHPLINILEKEFSALPSSMAIVATGPLTDGELAKDIENRFGRVLSFFDAASPIVTAESIDMGNAYFAARYGKGTPDYINCPMDQPQYNAFREALIAAEGTLKKDFEKGAAFFEACVPIEELAARGMDTLRYGPLKPVGLPHPVTGHIPYTVVQLRADNSGKSLYNIVGFQTNLRFGEQKRVFSMIPALKNAEFVRYGVMHRNSFLNSPGLLSENYEVTDSPGLFFAGQITGVEGYVESIASGMCAALSLAARIHGKPLPVFPKSTVIGALGYYISDRSVKDFQPMNANFGIMEKPGEKIRSKQKRHEALSAAAISHIKSIFQHEVQKWGILNEDID